MIRCLRVDKTSDSVDRIANKSRARWALPVVAVAAAIGGYFLSLHGTSTVAGLRVAGLPLGGVGFVDLDERLHETASAFLKGKVALHWGDRTIAAERKQLGFRVDVNHAVEQARRVGHSGHPLEDLLDRLRARFGHLDQRLPVEIDRTRAREFLTDLKDDVDRAPIDAHLDLERHAVEKEHPGYLLSVYESLARLEIAAESGATQVTLSTTDFKPTVTEDDLKQIDISTVLGSWETKYSSTGTDSDRTYNLKVGAEHLNGHILKPHEEFSFNQVVGDRTEKEGYRVAPVIQGGELIDGLAGGMCQIASTLHAASFFAGLDIVSSTPHSRPSAYIPMGLDSTVVYPTTDLKLSNPYDFAVVMHYSVHQGAVKVELLGKERPYRVIFEREIKREFPFLTETRSDPEAPAGQKLTLQEGYPGYTLLRRRYIFAKDQVPKWGGAQILSQLLKKQPITPIAKREWSLHYPATAQIVAIGAGSSSLKKKPTPPSHHIPPIAPKDNPIAKILR